MAVLVCLDWETNQRVLLKAANVLSKKATKGLEKEYTNHLLLSDSEHTVKMIRFVCYNDLSGPLYSDNGDTQMDSYNYMVTPYIERGTLLDELTKRGVLSHKKRRELCKHLAQSL